MWLFPREAGNQQRPGGDLRPPWRRIPFCCQACVDLFVTDPQQYAQETDDLIVYPTCLAEKPRRSTARLEYEGREVHFCSCPYCAELFQERPDYYIDRLEGNIPYEGGWVAIAVVLDRCSSSAAP